LVEQAGMDGKARLRFAVPLSGAVEVNLAEEPMEDEGRGIELEADELVISLAPHEIRTIRVLL
jgi:hypothetical protein